MSRKVFSGSGDDTSSNANSICIGCFTGRTYFFNEIWPRKNFFLAGPSCCPCCSPSFDNMDEFFFAPDCNMAGRFIPLLLLLLLLLSGVLMVSASGVLPAFDQKQSLLITDVKTILYDRLLSVCRTPGRQIVASGKKSAEIGQHILATSKIGAMPGRYSPLAF